MYIIIIIAIGIILLSLTIINKSKINREKITTYESGFHHFDENFKKFYIKFYLIGLIFLLFDLETILLYPISIYISNISNIRF